MFVCSRDFSLDLTLVEEEEEEDEANNSSSLPDNNVASSSSLDDDAFFQDCVSVQEEEEDHRPHSQHRLIRQSQGHQQSEQTAVREIRTSFDNTNKRGKTSQSCSGS